MDLLYFLFNYNLLIFSCHWLVLAFFISCDITVNLSRHLQISSVNLCFFSFLFLFFFFLVLLSALCCLFFKGCPVAGCYGSTDSFPCPDVNCHYCHKETGTCQMCQPGYIGPRCELSKLFVFELYKTSFFKLFLANNLLFSIQCSLV